VDSAADIYPDFDAVPAMILPYHNPDRTLAMAFERGGTVLPFCRMRYLEDPRQPKSFTKQKAKALRATGQAAARGFISRAAWTGATLVNDVQEPLLIITEGEAKALVAAYAGLPCMALGGVFNFMAGVEDLLPELEAIKWFGREVYIIIRQ
jgi:hypothetical protein